MGRQYHLITRDDRLETVAKDIVHHFLGRGFRGKAMVVSIDKATALRMYDKVRRLWLKEQARVEKDLAKARSYSTKADADEVKALQERLAFLESTDMALIVSPGQNEIEQMKKLGLDIAPHRKRMNDEALDEKFKDPEDPLRLVFVCAMWLTGFDAPSCSTVYLDKPMRNHTLMQTIARANRVFPGKNNGLIVDYANVFASLEKALAIYGKGKDGVAPLRDKALLVEQLRQALRSALQFCDSHGVSVGKIEQSAAGSLERLNLLAEAVNVLISPDPIRKEFLGHERLVATLYKAVMPDLAVIEFSSPVSCLSMLAGVIREQLGEGPGRHLVGHGKNRSFARRIDCCGWISHTGIAAWGPGGNRVIDLSAIDFEVLAKRFAKSKQKNVDLERLKAAIQAQLDKMIRLNHTRADFRRKFEELIELYNAGSRNIEELFEDLLNLSRALTEEQQRHVREHLSEAELTVFDLLTRPGPELTTEETDAVKKVARLLLNRLQQVLVLDWRKRQSSRAQVEDTIKGLLDENLPRVYSPEIYRSKCETIFQHVFESYRGEGESIFSEVA